jgi:hypothetical protein
MMIILIPHKTNHKSESFITRLQWFTACIINTGQSGNVCEWPKCSIPRKEHPCSN